MMPAPSFLDALRRAADEAAAAEDGFRRDIARRIKALEEARAVAFRRLNLMRTIAEAVTGADSEETAIAGATSALREKLGWAHDSEARGEVVAHFAPVARAMYASLAPPPAEGEAPKVDVDVLGALAEFERWYAETHPGPFWTLFDTYLPETPVVDF